MTPEEVLRTYDESYAYRYDESFLLTPEHGFLAKTQFEVELLRWLTRDAASWLDVACGTGYFLSYARGRDDLECAGFDLSPAMVAQARRRNPNARFTTGSFLDAHDDLVDRWDVTSCMWGAYGLQDTIADVETLVGNLAAWTRSGGTCFMPVFDLEQFEDRRVRGVLIAGVEIDMDGGRWSFSEPDGKCHRGMLAPPVPAMTRMFERHFASVDTFLYPTTPGQDDGLPMVGIVATTPSARGG
jgi:SAM-dependent methyltransferase